MAFTIACGDIMPGCTATFGADTQPELLEKVAAHATADHQITELTDELVATVNSAIRSV